MLRTTTHASTTSTILLVLAATVAATSSASALTPECSALMRSVVDARAARDLKLVESAIAAVDRSVGACEGSEKELLKREAALAYYDRASADGVSKAEAERLLREGLKHATPWKMTAWLGDIEYERRNFPVAARQYQAALDDMRDAKANPTPPPLKVIERIHKRAEQAAQLSSVYVAQRDKRGDPGGLAVADTRGFVAKKVAVPIQFVYKKTEFTEEGAKAAKEMAVYLSLQQVKEIRLIGHTDDVGSREYNLELSASRAAAVASFLKKNGYTGTVTTAGKGFDEPFQDDGSLQLSKPERDQLNRRVELERK